MISTIGTIVVNVLLPPAACNITVDIISFLFVYYEFWSLRMTPKPPNDLFFFQHLSYQMDGTYGRVGIRCYRYHLILHTHFAFAIENYTDDTFFTW